MSISTSEADIVFNRANVALARSQRLIASWLPPKTAEEIANTKTEEELLREEDEIFTPVPEKLGLGAPVPKSQEDNSFNRTELSANEKLRKQLLGKNYKKFTSNMPVNGSRDPRLLLEKKQQQHRQHAKEQPQSDDEDEGRSSLGRNKRKIVTEKTIQAGADGGAAIATPTTTATTIGNGDIDDLESDDGSPQRSAQRKKPASYLDELLSERSKKKKRKKNKKQS
ncbi:conserved hypothetical protein [Histoplasma capsulatum G186AR]|uniref:Uncharacterized protein n=2 Tax=Ajellomyces capsulatus TaxID=5037 RepID=C0NYR3_AJECG|nr:uncharacterized protein HCBG_08293 [Histoplasma capsulatum G186AR]EEH03353.1 conserved hypothetical protein [Histoplasma capsulatum G186AR]KAG5295763.1 DUF3245 superfamily domain-containing protein [Histoplasma capsulatum]QSS73744.1 DUF3245 superfamily domain-containing protein [Histoplasma capsulatum G186AR]